MKHQRHDDRDCEVDWERVAHVVKLFNKQYCMADAVLHDVFAKPLRRERLPLYCMAVNYFWKANVHTEVGALERICTRAQRKWACINESIEHLLPYSSPIDSQGSVGASEHGCRLLKAFLKAPRGHKYHYVFASKMVHWLSSGLMPIVDSHSAKSFNRLCGRKVIWTPDANTVTSEDLCLREYSKTLATYNGLLLQCPEQQQQELLRVDFETQPPQFRCRNTLLRILDKYLWLEGKQGQDSLNGDPTLGHTAALT